MQSPDYDALFAQPMQPSDFVFYVSPHLEEDVVAAVITPRLYWENEHAVYDDHVTEMLERTFPGTTWDEAQESEFLFEDDDVPSVVAARLLALGMNQNPAFDAFISGVEAGTSSPSSPSAPSSAPATPPLSAEEDEDTRLAHIRKVREAFTRRLPEIAGTSFANTWRRVEDAEPGVRVYLGTRVPFAAHLVESTDDIEFLAIPEWDIRTRITQADPSALKDVTYCAMLKAQLRPEQFLFAVEREGKPGEQVVVIIPKTYFERKDYSWRGWVSSALEMLFPNETWNETRTCFFRCEGAKDEVERHLEALGLVLEPKLLEDEE